MRSFNRSAAAPDLALRDGRRGRLSFAEPAVVSLADLAVVSMAELISVSFGEFTAVL
jgi:hypothetical protein